MSYIPCWAELSWVKPSTMDRDANPVIVLDNSVTLEIIALLGQTCLPPFIHANCSNTSVVCGSNKSAMKLCYLSCHQVSHSSSRYFRCLCANIIGSHQPQERWYPFLTAKRKHELHQRRDQTPSHRAGLLFFNEAKHDQSMAATETETKAKKLQTYESKQQDEQ